MIFQCTKKYNPSTDATLPKKEIKWNSWKEIEELKLEINSYKQLIFELFNQQ